MKNLPKKIYLNLNMTPQEVVETKDKDFHEATKTWEITWSEEQLSEHDPEYTRTDAFIKKASEWFKIRYEWIDIDGTRNYDKSAFEDFKNYMKDESSIY